MEEEKVYFILIGGWSFLVTVLWLVIGWRAMRAHERLAASMDEIRLAVRAWFRSKME